MTERGGAPLAGVLTAANVNEGTVLERLLDAIPAIRQRRGRRRRRPGKLHADKGYDSQAIRALLGRRHSVPRSARRGVESSQKLGRHRWVVERTCAWLHRHRRLLVRYARRADIHEAFLTLGCALICWHLLSHAT